MIITIKECIIPACEGADHRFEFERPTLREIKHMQDVAGVDIGAFEDGMNAALGAGFNGAAVDALLAIVDILHRRAGIRLPFEEIDLDFPSLDFDFGPDEEEPPTDEGEVGKADPAPTSPSLPPAGEASAEGSGPAETEASAPTSPPTPPTSGGGTG